MASKLKLEAVEKYGGHCQCQYGCGVSFPDFLEFAHLDQDGNQNRELRMYNGTLTLRRKLVGDTLLRHLKKAGWVHSTPETGRIEMLCKFCHTSYDKHIPTCGGLHEIR